VDEIVEPLTVAKLLKGVVEAEGPELVILGKQAIDDDANQTGQMVSALLGWSQGTFASKLEVEGSDFKVTREVDGGLQTIKLKGPAIVTTDLRLNDPRYASLPNIMKAKKKPIDDKSVADYGVDVTPRLEVLKTAEPAGRKAGVKVKDVAELVNKLLAVLTWNEAAGRMDRYATYVAATSRPGLTPAQRRLLFGAALRELSLPLEGV
jgi:electron transfer flavoprotein beta subunit